MFNKKYYTEEWKIKIEEAVKVSNSMAEAAKSINMHMNTFKKHAKNLGIYTPNPGGKNSNKCINDKYTLSDILEGKHPAYHSHKLKIRLIKEELKKHECELCNLTTWNGSPIPIELHHKDGNKLNNKLENLQILCPNCHAQSDNYKSKNNKTIKKCRDLTADTQILGEDKVQTTNSDGSESYSSKENR